MHLQLNDRVIDLNLLEKHDGFWKKNELVHENNQHLLIFVEDLNLKKKKNGAMINWRSIKVLTYDQSQRVWNYKSLKGTTSSHTWCFHVS